MNTRKAISILGFLLALVIILPVSRAAEYDQATKLTFNQSVQIPGLVLPPGTYWFVLADSSTGNRNIIHVFNSDRSMLFATVNTITAGRAQPSDHTEITFAERQSTQPSAIVTWFYPGHQSGHEFVYPKKEQQEFAQAKHLTVVAKGPAKHPSEVAAD